MSQWRNTSIRLLREALYICEREIGLMSGLLLSIELSTWLLPWPYAYGWYMTKQKLLLVPLPPAPAFDCP
jgi:hypothetical protein